jgi:hypothetical protein
MYDCMAHEARKLENFRGVCSQNFRISSGRCLFAAAMCHVDRQVEIYEDA